MVKAGHSVASAIAASLHNAHPNEKRYADGGTVPLEGNATLADALSPEQLANYKAMSYELPSQSSGASSTLPDYNELMSKPYAQDIVNQNAMPRPSTAEQAAEVLAPKELPAVIGERGLAPLAGQGTAEAAAEASSNLPAVIPEASSNLPAVIPEASSNLPAVLPEAASAASEGSIMRAAGALASKLGLPLTVAYEMLKSTPGAPEGDPDESKAKDAATKRSRDIKMDAVDASSLPPPVGLGASPSLFDMVSDKYKDLTPGMESGDSEVTSKQAATPVAHSTSAPAQSPAAPTSVNPVLAKYLQDRQELENAQQVSNKNRLIAGLSGAGGMLASSTYASNKPFEAGAFKQLDENANVPAENVVASQAAGAKSLQTQQEMMKAQATQEADDPNSALSKQMRGVYGPIFQRTGLPSEVLNGMSASEIKEYAQNPLEFISKEKATEASKQLQLEMMKARLGVGIDKTTAQHLMNAQTQSNNEAKKANEGVATAESALANLDLAKQNPVAWSAVPIQMARGMVNGQRINQAELSKLGGNQGGVMQKLEQIGKDAASGTISADNYNYFKQVAQALKNSATSERDAIVLRHAKQYSQLSGEPVDSAYQKISGVPMPSAPSAGRSPSSEGTINVIAPDGSTRAIPASKLQSALDAGGKLAQ